MLAGKRPAEGMLGFTVVWLGQLLSNLGTEMTRFALIFWAWELTNSATVLSLVAALTFGATVIFSPIAGALVDRWSRKLVIMFMDAAGGAACAVLLVLFLLGHLEIWHLYVVAVITGGVQAFQQPAYLAAVSTMVPEKQYVRANGMLELIFSFSGLVAPIGAALVLGWAGIAAVLTFDILTCVLAVTVLLFVVIPQPKSTGTARQSLFKDVLFGFRYMFTRRALVALIVISVTANVFLATYTILVRPMILARTAENVTLLGTVLSSYGLGALAGAGLLTAWGGPKRRMEGTLTGLLVAMVGMAVIGIGRSLAVWLPVTFIMGLVTPIFAASHIAIWQSKIPHDIQGRVFGARRLAIQASVPLTMLFAGVLADRLFEPAMAVGGPLSGLLGGVMGVGPGAGMGLLLVLSGFLGAVLCVVGFKVKVVRNVEREPLDPPVVPAGISAGLPAG